MSVLYDGISGPLPAGTRITQPFGYDPTYPGNSQHYHYGCDFGVPTGTDATFPADIGTVVIAAPFGGYGVALVVRVDEPGIRWYLLYGHLQAPLFAVGDTVKRGQVVAITNNTGFSTGAHLHFAVGRESYYGGWEDPLPWLKLREAVIVPPDPDQEWFMSLTDEQKAYLEAQATNAHVKSSQWLIDNQGKLSPYTLAADEAQFSAAFDTPAPNDEVSKGIRRLTRFLTRLQKPVRKATDPPGTPLNEVAYELSQEEGG